MKKPHGIMFHHFHDDMIHIKGQGSISANEFDDLLNYYEKSYQLISAEDYFEKTKKGKLQKKEVCLTFDDALRCQYDIAYPVLKRRNLSAFWFVYSSPLQGNVEKLEVYRHFRCKYFDNVEAFYSEFFGLAVSLENELKCNTEKALKTFEPDNYLKGYSFYTPNDKRFRYLRDKVFGVDKYNFVMDSMLEKYSYNVKENSQLLWMQPQNIKTLHSEGHIIGLHSHTHPTALSSYDYTKQKEEYSINKEILEEITQDTVTSVSYPCNSYNGDTVSIMKELGIKLGFRANIEEGYNSIYELQREDHSNIMRRMLDENNSIYK